MVLSKALQRFIASGGKIKKLKPQEFVKFENEIDSARREGRITN